MFGIEVTSESDAKPSLYVSRQTGFDRLKGALELKIIKETMKELDASPIC